VTTSADLEISLFRSDAGNFSDGDGVSYGIGLRYSDPESEADKRLDGVAPVHFDPAELRQRSLDPAGCGQYLAGQLLAEPAIRSFFDQATAAAQARNLPLRIRLAINPGAAELQNLRWETLWLPDAPAPLLTGQNVSFSRFLASVDWRPVRLRPEADLQALVVVADPSDAARFGLAPVKREAELAAARVGLGDIPVTELATRGQVTLNNIAAALRKGYDVLYLVAHGKLVDGTPWLFLEKEDGTAERMPGQDLVTLIAELEERPRLAVLVSCQSAGAGAVELTAQDNGALSGLGPRLAEAGVPAVVAMQGNVTMTTASAFIPAFFQELRRGGLADGAMSVARGAVRARPDWWMPVLFMRLKSGRIGYRAGFGDEREGLRKWPALLGNIQAGRCTPILGPGLTEWLLGSRRAIAARWAETFGYPMDPHRRDSLPQVAQYVAVDQDVSTMQRALVEHLAAEVRQRFGGILAPEHERAPLDEMISAVALQLGSEPVTQTLRVLASSPLPIYITTIFGNFLAVALRAAGKNPVVEMCRWNDYLEQQPSIFDTEPDYRPTPERPLVYHLFGRLSDPDSLVLTEDDYFDYLIGVTSRNDLIPGVVRRALADSALLFLGFDLDDWDFRVLFRSIMSREGSNRRSKYAHVAAQIDPEGGRISEPEGARRYLESYFGDADISIFWGNVADFGHELGQRLRTPDNG
jgi:hypothetical protein